MGLFKYIPQWWKSSVIRCIAILLLTRNALINRNLHDAYTDTETSAQAFPRISKMACRGHDFKFRTFDGRCNNLEQPEMGMLNYRFSRNVDPKVYTEDTSEARIMTPPPRTVSRELLSRKNGFKPVEIINLLGGSWIQFMIHDWVDHGLSNYDDMRVMPLEPHDPLFNSTRKENYVASRSIKNPHNRIADGKMMVGCTFKAKSAQKVPVHESKTTSWWDASQIYGVTLEEQYSVRTMKGGKLKIQQDGLLPLNEDGIPIQGFNRNWWLGLELLHTVFVMEHNSVCDMLKLKYPMFDDETLFQTSRLVISALLAKIHTVEWTPAILQTEMQKRAMHLNWDGRNILGWQHAFGMTRGPTKLNNKPFSLTEEFTSTYRMHSFMPDVFKFQTHGSSATKKDIPFEKTVFNEARNVLKENKVSDLLYSFGTSHPGSLSLNNMPNFMQDMTNTEGDHVDLGTIDILRDRERGVPRYNAMRENIGLPRVKSIDELCGPNKEQAQKLKAVYGDDIDQVDFLIGYLSESEGNTDKLVIPRNAFGETAFQIFILMASRRLAADRFFHEAFTADHYTKEGLDWVEKNSMSSVLLRHFPQFKNNLQGVESAFHPWKA
jgi:hypothetical protein